jgi:hypothetical protein
MDVKKIRKALVAGVGATLAAVFAAVVQSGMPAGRAAREHSAGRAAPAHDL